MEIAAIVFFEKKRTNDKDSLSASINKKLTEDEVAALKKLIEEFICFKNKFYLLQRLL